MSSSLVGALRAGGVRLRARALALVLGLAVAPVLAVQPASAQQMGRVTGQVIDAGTGQALVGAQLLVEGTGIGTITNNRGRYILLNVPAGTHTVSAQMIGYGREEQEFTVSAGGTASVDFELNQQAIEMESVVVTGTAGSARRRELGTTVSQINVDQLNAQPIREVSDVLQGRAAGVQVLENNGMAGGGTTIRLRGVASMQNNEPLIYIDGVRMSTRNYSYADEASSFSSPLSDVDPNEIERIEVVKGAAATTLYGTEAAAGVIQIFTKQGAEGAPVWSFSLDQGVNTMGHIGPEEDATGLHMNDCRDDPSCPSSGSWLSNGYKQKYGMSVRGGTNRYSYFVSGNWGEEDGVVKPQGQNEWGARGNFSFFPADQLRIQFNSAYTNRNVTWLPDGNNAEGFTLNVFRGTRDYTTNHEDAYALDMSLHTLMKHFTTGVGAFWTPGHGVTHRLNAGLDLANSDYTEERPWGFFRVPLGDRESDQRTTRTMTLDYAGTWEYDVPMVTGIKSSLSWGGQIYEDDYVQLNGFGENFSGPGDKLLDSGSITSAGENRINEVSGGFFLQEQVGWNDRLFLTAGGRWDGFSTFGEDFGMAFYPKLSASYMLSDHAFWPRFWETMKLRAAYGESGTPPGPFDALRTWDSTSGDEGQPAVVPRTVGALDLGPERTREIEFGFESSLFDGRLQLEFTSYNQRTYDALVGVRQLPSGGLGDLTQLQNVGEIKNWGTETTLNVSAVRTPTLAWDVGFRFSTNGSEVVKLTNDVEDIYVSWRNHVRVGYPMPVFIHPYVQNGDQVGVDPIMADSVLGQMYPTHTWSANTSLTVFRRLTLDVLGEFQGGHVLSNGTGYQNTRRDEWVPCQDIDAQYSATGPAGLKAWDIARCVETFTTYGMWTEPADFFKLRSASLSYRVPESLLGDRFSSAIVSLQGRNLFTITDYTGLDPEVSQIDGSGDAVWRQEYYQLPPFTTYSLSIRVTM